MYRIASILVSGKLALQANSDKHFTESWKESIIIGKCLLYRSSEIEDRYRVHYKLINHRTDRAVHTEYANIVSCANKVF